MGISIYSIWSSILLFNLILILLFTARRSKYIRMKDAPSILVAATILCVVRLILPLDLPQAIIIRSYSFMPRLMGFLRTALWNGITTFDLLLIVWALGSVVVIIHSICSHAKYVRRVSSYEYIIDDHILELAKQAGLRCDIRISPNVPTPYTTGLIHRRLYLPVLDLSDKQWEFVLLHEKQHMQSKDLWVKALYFVIRVLFWWNPLAHISIHEIDLMLELRCDWNVTRKADKEQQLDYLATLRDVLIQSKAKYVPASASTFVDANKAIEARFDAVLNRQENNECRLHRIVALSLLVMAFALTYFVVLQPAGFPTEKEILATEDGRITHDVTPDDCESQYIFYDGVNYYLCLDGEKIGVLDEQAIHSPPCNSLPIITGG